MDYADSHFTQIGVPEWLMAFAQGQQPVCPVSGKTGKERLPDPSSLSESAVKCWPSNPSATLLYKDQKSLSRMMSIKVTIKKVS